MSLGLFFRKKGFNFALQHKHTQKMNAMRFLTLIIALTISNTLFSQTFPRLVDKSILVQSRILPSDFQLFLPDTASQVLFNPARAALGSRQFIYTTYFPSSSSFNSKQTLFFASLFNWGGAQYVFQATHGVLRGENQTNDRISVDFTDLSAQKLFSEDVQISDFESFAMPMSLKLSRVWKSGLSLGVYGIIHPSNSRGESRSSNLDNRRDTLSASRERNSQNFSAAENDFPGYAFGAEWGVAKKRLGLHCNARL